MPRGAVPRRPTPPMPPCRRPKSAGQTRSTAARRTSRGRLSWLTVEGTPQRRKVELLHPQHGLEGAFRRGDIGRIQHLLEALRHDLPREAEPVLQPAALLRVRVAARAKLFPKIIHLGLRPAPDLKGHGLG